MPQKENGLLTQIEAAVLIVVLGLNIGELEALAASGEQMHHLRPVWASGLVYRLNELNVAPAKSRGRGLLGGVQDGDTGDSYSDPYGSGGAGLRTDRADAAGPRCAGQEHR